MRTFVDSDGNLVRHAGGVLRENFARHHSIIRTGQDVRASLRAGPSTDLGGYPVFFLTSDGESLSFDSVSQNLKQVLFAVRHHLDDGWRVLGVDVNYECPELRCAHSGDVIPCAYA